RGRFRRLIGQGTSPDAGLRRAIARLYASLELKPGETEEDIVRDACADTSFDLENLRREAEALLAGLKTDKERGEDLAAWLANPDKRVETFAAYLSVYFTEKGMGKPRDRQITGGALKSAPGIDAALITEMERLERAVLRCNAARTASSTSALLRVGARL